MASGLGSFSVFEPLGRGGMGEVFRARHLRVGLEVAVKTVPADTRPHRLRAFYRELCAIARIDHPHVLDLLAAGVAEAGEQLPAGTPWMAMELALGSLAQRPPGSFEEAREVLRAVLAGLGAVHARGVLHRDLTPGNVLDCGVPGNPFWRLSDFGLASLNGAGLRGGTTGFASPEQRSGAPEGPPGDLYAVGCLAHWAVCGHPPTDGPFAPRFAVPGDFGEWLDRCLKPDPRERFGHARAAWLALAGLGRGGSSTRRAVGGRASSATWVEDDEVTAILAVDDTELVPPPGSWIELAGEPSSPRTWGLRSALASDPGLALLAERPVPLVGRVTERDRLWLHLLDAAALAPARLVRVAGPPGVGTSRLLAWVSEVAAASGAWRAAFGVEGEGPRLWLLDGDEPERLAEGVRGAAPGLLVVAAGEGSADDRVALRPLGLGELSVLSNMLGARDINPIWSAWWSKGRPGVVAELVERLVRRSPGELVRQTRPLPPISEEESEWVARASEAQRLEAATRFVRASDGQAGDTLRSIGRDLAAYASFDPETRAALHREYPTDDPPSMLFGGRWTELANSSGIRLAALLRTAFQELSATLRTRAERWSRRPVDVTLPDEERLCAWITWAGDHRAPPEERVAACEQALAMEVRPAVEVVRLQLYPWSSSEATETCDRSRNTTDPVLAVCVARILRLRGRATEAERMLPELHHGNHAPVAAIEAGELARARGDLAAAERHYLRALEHEPRADAWMNLALLRLDRGDPGGAEKGAMLAALLFDDPNILAANSLVCARASCLRDEPAEALKRLRVSVRILVGRTEPLDPDFALQAAALIDDLQARGRLAEAAAARELVADWSA